MRDEGQDELHQALLNILANREEELRATIQAIDTRQLRQILSLLRSCEVYKEICLSQLSKEEVAKTL